MVGLPMKGTLLMSLEPSLGIVKPCQGQLLLGCKALDVKDSEQKDMLHTDAKLLADTRSNKNMNGGHSLSLSFVPGIVPPAVHCELHRPSRPSESGSSS